MTSVASRGTTDRITARILFKVLRAGSGIFAMYSSVFLGTALPFFIREILQAPSFLVYAQDSMRPYGAGVRASASGIGACAQLHHPESAAGPGLRDRPNAGPLFHVATVPAMLTTRPRKPPTNA